MALQRVQLLLESQQRRKLVKLAKARGKSVAEITRQAIDIGLEKLIADEQQERMQTALMAAAKLRDSMPMLNVDVVADLHLLREERDHDFFRDD